jgi:hypothetical protein
MIRQATTILLSIILLLVGGNKMNKPSQIESEIPEIILIIHPVGSYGEDIQENYYFILDDSKELTYFSTSNTKDQRNSKTLSAQEYDNIATATQRAVDNYKKDIAGWDDTWQVTLLYQGKRYYRENYDEAGDLKILADIFIEISGFMVDMYSFE